MKRRLSKMAEVKFEPEEVRQTASALMAQLASALLEKSADSCAVRFGRVAFDDQEQQSVNAFLHQKLGKDSIARRPGPGGRKLIYIESCKAIELANRAFGFNGWSCRIVECQEEYKEKKGDRWSIAYSSLVRIELKDGTSHEDVGFGTSDGQRDLGAALEQAKKASISDARKRALRLFGEYLGNSCYDKDHIKDVNSNRPMAPVAATPHVTIPEQKQQTQEASTTAESIQSEARISSCQPQHFQAQQQQLPQQQQQDQTQQRALNQQPQQQCRQPQSQVPHQLTQQQQSQHRPQHWKPPQIMCKPNATAMQEHTQTKLSAKVTNKMLSPKQMAKSNTLHARHGALTTPDLTLSPFPHPQRWVSSNAPPRPRVVTAPAIVKVEQSVAEPTRPNAQYSIEDLSFSQFDYDPNTDNDNPAKKMRPG
ncbi:dna repair and recombination protein [Plasmopara halstedii]|uniref:Dna repair and recombination protein n=1 Tax=Plasmopara halstedii TaxID=4781 RepID=A0A0P1AVJ8_PLAHL|nr:dna repair and recombination protein [Plasmopara halstedii]CEG45433.1 dna repair and recombination protein [Plasmopara halstedii]|eukprot:XP_024581802.1 dna repair and recombination protein [Plasmopara halstedii]